MRRKWLGSLTAVLAATRLSAAPPTAPPAPLPQSATVADDTQAQPKTLPPPGAPSATTPPAAAGTVPCPPVADATKPAGPGFHDDHCGPCDTFWVEGGPVLYWLKEGPGPLLAGGGGQSLNGGYDYG